MISNHRRDGPAFRALAIDYKTGWDSHDASSDLQMRTYAVLIHQHFAQVNYYGTCPALVEVSVCIVERGATPTVVTYSADDLNRAAAEIEDAVWQAENASKDDLVPGEKQCRWCPANYYGTCPALANSLTYAHELSEKQNDPVAYLPALTPTALCRRLDLMRAVRGYCNSLEAEAKRRLEGGEKLPINEHEEYYLADGAMKRKVKDAQDAFDQLGVVDAKTFRECCEVKISKLETAYRHASGFKGKAARAEFERLLDGNIEFKRNRPSLARRTIQKEVKDAGG